MTNPETVVCRENVEFAFKGPVPVYFDEEKRTVSGCATVDIVLAKPSRVGEILFRNYYVASVNVLVQTADNKDEPGGLLLVPSSMNSQQLALASGGGAGSRSINKPGAGPWSVSVPRKDLMPNVHEEEGSHDFFSIPATESQVPWDNVIAFRILLRQPSPLWATFRLDEFNLFADLPRINSIAHVPHSVAEANKLFEIVRRQTVRVLNNGSSPATDGGPPNYGDNQYSHYRSETAIGREYPQTPQLVYEIQKLPTS